MPRKPTGKRVRCVDGTFIVVNKAGNRAGSVFHVPERQTTLPTAASASDGRIGGRLIGTRCRGASTLCQRLPVTR